MGRGENAAVVERIYGFHDPESDRTYGMVTSFLMKTDDRVYRVYSFNHPRNLPAKAKNEPAL